MPELPEVETVVRTLEHQIKGETIQAVHVLWDKIIVGDVEYFRKKLKGQSFRKFGRRGKYLIFELDDINLVCHLRMEGKFFYTEKVTPLQKHEHVVFQFKSGKELRYHDVRKFGKMELYPLSTDWTDFKGLGPEPWEKEFNSNYCKEALKNRKGSIKQTLLDQSFVAGVGNIYADEICFQMKVNPARSCQRLTEKNRNDLILATQQILKQACDAGGTTIRSYTSSLGVTGRFQLEVKVHQRKDQPCPVCKTKIKKTKVATRGTYYCPTCQKR
ncbi:MAG: DNA-formamidopyrimidine glycosylase [Anaerorhabdus sp.]